MLNPVPEIKFPMSHPKPRRFDNLPFAIDYYHWFLVKDGEPTLCLNTDGLVISKTGNAHGLLPLYRNHNRMWVVITAVEIARTTRTRMPDRPREEGTQYILAGRLGTERPERGGSCRLGGRTLDGCVRGAESRGIGQTRAKADRIRRGFPRCGPGPPGLRASVHRTGRATSPRRSAAAPWPGRSGLRSSDGPSPL